MITLHTYLAAKGVRAQGRNWMVRCPVHDDRVASCSVAASAWTCFGCGARGGVLDFIQAAEGCSRHEAARIAEYGGQGLDLATMVSAMAPRRPRPSEVAEFWRSLGEVPQAELDARNLGTPSMELARWCADQARPAWAEHFDRRIVCPLFDYLGQLRLCLGRSHRSRIKTMVAKGFSSAGLCLATPAVVLALRTGCSLGETWITEGEVDFLTAARFKASVLGVRSGSWSAKWRERIQALAASVVVATDPDEAGDKYAADIGMGRRWRQDCDLNDWVSRGGEL